MLVIYNRLLSPQQYKRNESFRTDLMGLLFYCLFGVITWCNIPDVFRENLVFSLAGIWLTTLEDDTIIYVGWWASTELSSGAIHEATAWVCRQGFRALCYALICSLCARMRVRVCSCMCIRAHTHFWELWHIFQDSDSNFLFITICDITMSNHSFLNCELKMPVSLKGWQFFVF